MQHIVVQADLGTKVIERYKSSSTEFTKYTMENVSRGCPVHVKSSGPFTHPICDAIFDAISAVSLSISNTTAHTPHAPTCPGTTVLTAVFLWT